MRVCIICSVLSTGKGETNEQEDGPLGGGVPQDTNAGGQSEVHAPTKGGSPLGENVSSVGKGHATTTKGRFI